MKTKKILFLFLGLAMVLFTGCSSSSDDDKDVVPTGVTLDQQTLSLAIGQTITLKAKLAPDNAKGTIVWSSSDSKIATVDANGTVTAVATGDATIAATIGALSATCKVTVSIAPTGLALDKKTLSCAIGQTSTIVATITPAGAGGTVVWTTSDATIATVDKGVVTGVKVGSATITATIGSLTATCAVTITAVASLPPSLQGSNYYLISMDATTQKKIASKVVADYRTDDAKTFLYVWPDGTSYTAGKTSGLNFYGEAESWINLVVGTLGWSGAGFFVSKDAGGVDLRAVSSDISKYYFHVALKSTQPNTSHAFVLYDDGGNKATLVIGAVALEGVQPYANFTRDGEWQEIEVPMSYFANKGINYKNVCLGTNGLGENVLGVLSGGTQGTILDMDAAFIYKK